MSQVKRHMEEIDERGYGDVDGTVCSNCITEPALAHIIRSKGTDEPCDHCGETPSGPEASVPLERVVQLVTEGIESEYEDPVVGAAYDGREGGYRVSTIDTYDLLRELEVAEDDQLLDDIRTAIRTELWCQKDPYSASDTEALQSGWEAFRTYVKHQRRYTFLTRDDSTADGAGAIPMHGVPAAVVRAIAESGLTTIFPVATTWWRARVHDPGEVYSSAGDLGSPPARFARDNRMSPKGIGAFYGASTPTGARSEVAGYASSHQEATLGEFTQLTDIEVVDLRDLPSVPSLFDASRRHLRGPLRFLQDFITDVTKIADPTDTQNLEYIPTQVIAEHMRYDLPVDGIVWRSTKDRDVTVSILFFPNESMAESGSPDPEALLQLEPGTVTQIRGPL
ncbi:MAG: HEPN-associated N-terminal domain-containing protein [Candidatus Nanopelagicales bacterium]